MKTATAVTLVICGTILCTVPWLHDVYVVHRVTKLLSSGSNTVNLNNQIQNSTLGWWTLLAGLGMIAAAALGSLGRSDSSSKS